MVDGPAAGASADKVNMAVVSLRVTVPLLFEEGEVGFEPGILVAADYDGRTVCVEEQDGAIWRGGCEEMVLDAEVDARVVRCG